MDNNQMNFDPMTGQPLNQNAMNNQDLNNNINYTNNAEMPQTNNTSGEPQATNINSNDLVQNAQYQPNQNIMQPQQDVQSEQSLMQSVPNVEQSAQEFIHNTQNIVKEKNNEKKEGVNYWFLISLLIIILLFMIYVFPLLLNL